MVMDHEALSSDPKKRHHHQRYVDVELKHKKLLEQKLQEVFQGRGPSQPAVNVEALLEENRQLRAENLALKEDKAKDSARHKEELKKKDLQNQKYQELLQAQGSSQA